MLKNQEDKKNGFKWYQMFLELYIKLYKIVLLNTGENANFGVTN